MALFDDIYDIAADGHGIITAAQAPAARPRRVQARALGAHAPQRLRRSRGARGRRGIPAWRARVRHARPGAGRPSRNRGRDAEADAPKGERTTSYEDIPSQRVADAIKSSAARRCPPGSSRPQSRRAARAWSPPVSTKDWKGNWHDAGHNPQQQKEPGPRHSQALRKNWRRARPCER